MRPGLHSSIQFPDERHCSAPTAALVTDQTTDHVQAGDSYFQGEVLSDPTVSSRTALRPSGRQNTLLYYRSTVLPTICVHRLRLSGILLNSAPQVWNCLGTSTRSANTFSSFRRRLKSELFAAAYDTYASYYPPTPLLIRLATCRYTNFGSIVWYSIIARLHNYYCKS